MCLDGVRRLKINQPTDIRECHPHPPHPHPPHRPTPPLPSNQEFNPPLPPIEVHLLVVHQRHRA